MSRILIFFIVFIIGVLYDYWITKYTKAVSGGNRWSASILAGLITIANYTMIVFLVTHMDQWINIFSFALGNFVGTFLAMNKVENKKE